MIEFNIKTLFPTPQHFFEFTQTFSNRIYDRDGIRRFRVLYKHKNTSHDSRFDSNTPPIDFYFGAHTNQKVFAWWTNNDNVGAAKLVAQKGPNATTILFVRAEDKVWQKVEPFWQLLHAEMREQGWIQTPIEIGDNKNSQITNINIGAGAQVGQVAAGTNIIQTSTNHRQQDATGGEKGSIVLPPPETDWAPLKPREIAPIVLDEEGRLTIKLVEPYLGQKPCDLIRACYDFFDEWVIHSEWRWFRVIPNSGELAESYESSVRLVGKCVECVKRESNSQNVAFTSKEIFAEAWIAARNDKLVVKLNPRYWACLAEAWKIFRVFLANEGLVGNEQSLPKNRPTQERNNAQQTKRWDDTEEKLNRLRKYRIEWMNEHDGEPPKWIGACQSIGIDPKTARRHDPELRKRWEDKEFREL
ncbi:MAG: hypothetical protein EYC68_04035 [Chloroflexota bacterium]|nr:MAG: hypothetical protein EYC68_04035 [Chloroflexota bacterium]